MEKNIIESNKLIAEFDGLIYLPDNDYYLLNPEELVYNERWDWLMPVVEKISSLHLKYSNAEEYYYPYPRTFGMLDEYGNFMVRLNSEPLFTAPTLIEATYDAVVYFIKNYSPEV